VWKTAAQPDRPEMTIRRKCIAFWIYKATNTHSEYVINIVSLLQKWLQEHGPNFTLHVHCMSCYIMRAKIKFTVTRIVCGPGNTIKIPYFSIDYAHLMYNAHPKLFDILFYV
jgi:hypothetical protein